MTLTRTPYETELRFNAGEIQQAFIRFSLSSTDGIAVGRNFTWERVDLPSGLRTAIEQLFTQLIAQLDIDDPFV